MESQYCERGHVGRGDTCSHCARRQRLAAFGRKPKPGPVLGPNATLVELRALKSLLDQGLITEAAHDERRNAILASF
ncbi:SHOCT domain-containing protein [Hymenobacter sp. BT523]|uniref:SHOCT domain-containing protein n=1 Tax=Hymenobacter sp. BT523 TaxID=2795725 RepID=UPI0018EE28AA|nr:SHOCT domain-containing protein [Hymenobacter sp. BT523]MBJ6110025.1 SHOCT domain-containing protein [Hymenobacter sp. BT523]